MEQAIALVDANYGIGVADIDCDQHRATSMTPSSRMPPSRIFPLTWFCGFTKGK